VFSPVKISITRLPRPPLIFAATTQGEMHPGSLRLLFTRSHERDALGGVDRVPAPGKKVVEKQLLNFSERIYRLVISCCSDSHSRNQIGKATANPAPAIP
jgi:hypothetical protein